MTTLSIAEARNGLAEAINRVNYGGERIVFARRGKPVAALVSAEDLTRLQAIEDAEDIRDARKALRDYEKHGGITLEEFRKKRGL